MHSDNRIINCLPLFIIWIILYTPLLISTLLVLHHFGKYLKTSIICTRWTKIRTHLEIVGEMSVQLYSHKTLESWFVVLIERNKLTMIVGTTLRVGFTLGTKKLQNWGRSYWLRANFGPNEVAIMWHYFHAKDMWVFFGSSIMIKFTQWTLCCISKARLNCQRKLDLL